MEEWKEIKGYEGLYQVSNTGRIKSLERTIIRKNGRPIQILEKCIAQQIMPSGYVRVNLSKDGIGHKYYVHRLVADAFIENPEQFPEVNHKNENKVDNRVENLEWCTPSYNQNYGTVNERRSDIYVKKGISRPVVHIGSDCIRIFRTATQAAKVTGIGVREIYANCYGKDDKWKFLDSFILGGI